MNELILTPEQVASLAGPQRAVVVKTPDGQELGKIYPPLSAEQVAEMKAKTREGRPWYSGGQVQARLKALDAEWARTGGFDQEYMTAFLAKLSELDPATYGPTE